MKVTIQNVGAKIVVEIEGNIDSRTAPSLQNLLLPLAQPDSSFILDMSAVGFMSSAGLRVLLALRRQLPEIEKIMLVGLSEQIQDTMSTTGFLEMFDIQAVLPSSIAVMD